MSKNTIRIAGALFLVAMAASLIGASLVQPAVSSPLDKAAITQNKVQTIFGVLLELVNAAAVVGIAAIMYSALKRYGKAAAAAYFGFRIVEAVCCSAIVISPLSIINLSAGVDNLGFEAAGSLLAAQRASAAGLLIPIFFGVGALIFYRLLYRSRLIPRFIPVWGLIAALLMLAQNLSAAFVQMDVTIGMITALPIILNEIFLGVWLIAKGFKSAEEFPGGSV